MPAGPSRNTAGCPFTLRSSPGKFARMPSTSKRSPMAYISPRPVRRGRILAHPTAGGQSADRGPAERAGAPATPARWLLHGVQLREVDARRPPRPDPLELVAADLEGFEHGILGDLGEGRDRQLAQSRLRRLLARPRVAAAT